MSEMKLQQCRVDGRYDVLDCLGRGSYSEVYVARDVAASDGSPQMVVLKVLNQYLQGAPDPELEQTLIDNFRNEAIALDRVRHPNIISRLGHGTAIDLQGRAFHYLVLEYLPGGDMQQLCRRRPLKLEGALFYLQQVASGLGHAHAAGVIHRDVKPQNLLLTADQHTLKIADFGVAKLEADGIITRVGTDVYAAPEHHPLIHTGQLDTSSLDRANLNLTPAADVYSLAKTAYTFLTGEPPRRFSQKPITALPEQFSHEPWAAYVVRVLERATQTRPEKRHQSVREFWEDLKDAALPQTSPLGGNGADVAAVLKELESKPASVPPAPPVPVFKKPAEPSAPDPSRLPPHLRIVVPLGAERPVVQEMPPADVAPHPDSRYQNVPAPFPAGEPTPRRGRFSEGAKRWLVALVLVAAFAGMLLATHVYFRREPQATVAPTAPGASPVGRELVATTDVNLRVAPGGKSAIKGLVPKESVVKVLGVNGNWYQVQVVEYARPKEKPEYQDQGWVNSDLFKDK